MLQTLGQNVALILHDVLGAKVPLSGTTENGSKTCHWKFVTSSLTNKEYNKLNLNLCIVNCTSAAVNCKVRVISLSLWLRLITLTSTHPIIVFNYTTQAVRGPITKINQSKCSVASPIFSNIFDNYFQYANDIHSYNTRYATNKNLNYKPCTRTNNGKQSVSSIVVDLWQDLSTSLKNLNTFTFPGKVKESPLKTQFSNLPI